MNDWEDEFEGDDEPERPLTREERLEELYRRRQQSRRGQRSSRMVGLLAVAILFGGAAWISRPLWWPEAAEPTPDRGLSRSLMQLRAWAKEGRFDEAEARLRELADPSAATLDKARVRAAQEELDQIRERQAEGMRAVNLAVATADRGALGEALAELEHLLVEFAELAAVRGQAMRHYEILRERRAARGGVDELVGYDEATEETVVKMLEAGEFAKALKTANGLMAADEDEEYSLAVLQRKVRDDTMAAGRALLRRVARLVNSGKLLVAVQMLYREEIPELADTEAWPMLMQRAEEIEDLIDERGGLRPFPRRRHLR